MKDGAPRIAAIVPCFNEEAAIAKVVSDLRQAVPEMDIYVYDNNSSDRTAEVAEAAGAIVRSELRKGKGNVVRRAFADVDADIYVMIDGDDTYDTCDLPHMIDVMLEGPYDHVLGVRKERNEGASAYRPGHSLGNKIFNRLVSLLFKSPVTDMLSGYRVFSKRFVKSFPAVSREFEIETELTIHYQSLRLPAAEVEVGFGDRAAGTESKLNTYRDGIRILGLIASMFRRERPLAFNGILGTIAMVVSFLIGIPVVCDFVSTGSVPRLPSAVLASSLFILGVLAWTTGVSLAAQARERHEAARLFYLQYRAVR